MEDVEKAATNRRFAPVGTSMCSLVPRHPCLGALFRSPPRGRFPPPRILEQGFDLDVFAEVVNLQISYIVEAWAPVGFFRTLRNRTLRSEIL